MRFFKNRTVVGIGCILLSLLICFGITPMFNRQIQQKTTIVRVVKEIKEGDQITKDMIQTVEVGSYHLPDNVIKSKETVLGCYALADLSNGDYIINSKVSKTPAAENAYLFHLDGSRQAISITLKSFAKGLSGKLEQGDIVSVIAPDYKKQGATVIPPELRYVEVISVTTANGDDANTGEKKKNSKEEKELPSTVTLLVTPEQGNVLASLEAEGECHLSLVYRGESKNAKKFLDVQKEALETLYPKEELEEESKIGSTQALGSEKAIRNTQKEENTLTIEAVEISGKTDTTEHSDKTVIQQKNNADSDFSDDISNDLGHAEEE